MSLAEVFRFSEAGTGKVNKQVISKVLTGKTPGGKKVEVKKLENDGAGYHFDVYVDGKFSGHGDLFHDDESVGGMGDWLDDQETWYLVEELIMAWEQEQEPDEVGDF